MKIGASAILSLFFILIVAMQACQPSGSGKHQPISGTGQYDTAGIIPAMIKVLESGDRSAQTRRTLDSLVELSRKAGFIPGIARGIMMTGAFLWGNPDSAIHYLSLARQYSLQHHYNLGYFLSTQNMGSLYLNYGMQDSAIRSFLAAMACWTPEIGMQRHAKLQLDIGSWYSSRDDFKQSLKFLLPAMISMKKTGDTIRLRSAYNSLGVMYTNLLNFEKAKYYYEQIFLITPELYMKGRFWANNYNNLGKLYLTVGENYDSALLMFRKSLHVATNYQLDEKLNIIYLNLGIAFFELKQFDSATYYLHEAIGKIDKFIPSTYAAAIYINYGVSLMTFGKIDSAKYYGVKGMALLKKEGAGDLKIAGYKLLFRVDSARGQYLSAIRYMQKAGEISEALHNREILMKVAEKEFAYELDQKNSENNYLKRENSLKAGIIKNQEIILAFAILIILMIAGILIFISYNRKKLLRLNHTKDKFISIISHDLRSPFNSLLGLLNELNSGYIEFTDEERIHILAMLETSSQNTYRLLENLLEWTHAQQGTLTSNPEMIAIKPHVIKTIDLLKPRADKKGVVIRIEISEDIMAFADPILFNNCILNITNNAIKFTPGGKTITLSAIEKEKSVIVCCSDTGIGIPHEYLGQLFLIDGKVKRRGTDEETGTGLGLILCKEFIGLMKGKITVESKENEGTKVCIELPSGH